MAETGNPGVLATEVGGAAGVDDVVPLLFPNNDFPDSPPIMPPGESNSTTITASGNSKYFSAVGMLAATNDGFYAIRGVALPKNGSVTVYANVYDAGSETNTEELDDIPAGGAIPTLKWIPGAVIRDRHRLQPPPNADLSNATLELAVYDHFTGHVLGIGDPRLARLYATVPLLP